MLDAAKLGQLHQYYTGIRRLTELFPNDWATISLLDEEVRSEIWPRLYEEITEGVRDPPRGYDAANPWGSIIAESRFDYLQGPLGDYWRRKEVQLERAARVKPSGRNLGEAPGAMPAPKLPGHLNATGAASSGWGSGGAQPRQPGTPSAPGQGKKAARNARRAAAAGKAAAKAQPENKGKGKGKRKTNALPENFAGCFYCKGNHFLRDCTKWIAAGKPEVEGAKRRKTT